MPSSELLLLVFLQPGGNLLCMICHDQEDVADALNAFIVLFLSDCVFQGGDQNGQIVAHLLTSIVVSVHTADSALDVLNHMLDMIRDAVVDMIAVNCRQYVADGLGGVGKSQCITCIDGIFMHHFVDILHGHEHDATGVLRSASIVVVGHSE